jgi:hypothetical protein
MASDGYSNKVLIGNWFEDRILDNHIKTKMIESSGHTIKPVDKIIMDYGHVF